MPISGSQKTVTEDGEQKEALDVTFTNGAKQQLEELQKFIGVSDPLDVIKLGISIIQRAKETADAKEGKNGDPENPS